MNAVVTAPTAAVPLKPKSAKKRRALRLRFTHVKKVVKKSGFDAFQVRNDFIQFVGRISMLDAVVSFTPRWVQ